MGDKGSSKREKDNGKKKLVWKNNVSLRAWNGCDLKSTLYSLGMSGLE